MVLDCVKPIHGQKRVYLIAHMALDGYFASKDRLPRLQSIDPTTQYPPKHARFILEIRDNKGAVKYEVAWSESRCLGSIKFALNQNAFDMLAPDALLLTNDETEDAIMGLARNTTALKTILLKQRTDDKKSVMSGVGQWIADEVCYQCQIHPSQAHLTLAEARILVAKLKEILDTTMVCYKDGPTLPSRWLFAQNWKKKQVVCLDAQGRVVKFIEVGGKNTPIVESIQILQDRKQIKGNKKNQKCTRVSSPKSNDQPQSTKKKTRPPAIVTPMKSSKRKTIEPTSTETAIRASTRKKTRSIS